MRISPLVRMMRSESDTPVRYMCAPSFIQAFVSYLDEGAGSNVGAESSVSLPWLLSRTRRLRPGDLFANPGTASAALARLAIPRLNARSENSGDSYDLRQSQVENVVQPVKYWSLKKSGLAIVPDTNNGIGPAMLTAVELSIVIPWGELRPYLRSDMAVDVGTLLDTP